jgi:hypothetical protein
MPNTIATPNLNGAQSPPLLPVVIRDLDHLHRTVSDAMQAHGSMVNLNHLDVSGVLIFDGLFENSTFNGCINKWDTGRAKSMSNMFKNSSFNGELSEWNVKKVHYMTQMFKDSAFTGDLSKWDVSCLERTDCMFEGAAFNGDLSQWHLRKRFDSLNMFNGNFRGKMPILNTNHGYSVYAVYASMLGGVQQMNAYAKWTDFSHVHASMLLEASEKCTWASQEVMRWALMVGDLGRSMGLNMQEQRSLLVEQHKKQLQPELTMVVDGLFDIEFSSIVP